MKDIVIKMRFVFPPNMRKYMKHHDGGKGTDESIRMSIQALVNAWEEDISTDYFQAEKEKDKR